MIGGLTHAIIIPGKAGTWELRTASGSIAQFKSFREAQRGLRSLLTPDEFASRFPATDMVIRRESRDRPHAGGMGRPAGYAGALDIQER